MPIIRIEETEHPTLSNLPKTQADPRQGSVKNLVTKFVLLARGVNSCGAADLPQVRKQVIRLVNDLDWKKKRRNMQCHVTRLIPPPYSTVISSNTSMMGASFSPQSKISTFKVVFKPYWTKLFTMVKLHLEDHGELPNKACFHIAADFKICNNAFPPYATILTFKERIWWLYGTQCTICLCFILSPWSPQRYVN